MFSAEALRDLFRHMEWADATVWAAALKTEDAADDTKLRNDLLHLHGVQQAWLAMWTDRPPGPAFPKAEDFPDLVSVQQWARPYYADATAFLYSVDETRLGEDLHIPWTERFEESLDRRAKDPTLAETVFQVASHSTHHRGQVNRSLRQLGGEPPPVDYIAWVWFGKPTTEWDG